MNLPGVESVYPLTPMQQGMLFHTLSDPASAMYGQQAILTLQGPLDTRALRSAWEHVVARHPALRTYFLWEGTKEPVQVVALQVELPWEDHDWTDRAEEEAPKGLDSLLRADRARGLRLDKPPLLRLAVARLGPQVHQLVWSFHHMLLDGWSVYKVLKEVFVAYEVLREGRSPELEPSRPYRDYIAWLRTRDHAGAESFWSRELAGLSAPTPVLDCLAPTERATPEPDAEPIDTRVLRLDADTSKALTAFARSHQLTLNSVLQGAWAILLSRYSGEEDVCFGATVSGRPPELEGVDTMVGLFINTLPVRARVPGGTRLLPWLRELQERQAEARQYEWASLVDIQGWSPVPRDLSLFETLLVFANYPVDTSLSGNEGSLRVREFRTWESSNYALNGFVQPGAETSLGFIYDRRRCEDGAVTRMLGHWRMLLEGIVSEPQGLVRDLPILTPNERWRTLVQWNDTRTEYPRDRCVHELFEDQATRTPNAVAVACGGAELTYRELNLRANQLGHHLRGLGVRPNTLVGICMERSLELIVGLLGILKAGGAYVPLDPSYPQERLAFMIEDARGSLLLSQQHLLERLPSAGSQVVCLDRDWREIAQGRDDNPPTRNVAEDLAYVTYTSGSTGRPKGACIPHRGVVRLVKGTGYARFDADEVFLQFAPVSFDASTFEIWGCLLNGARLVVFPPHTPSLEELGEVIQREKVTTLWLTAGLFHQMVERHPQGLRTVRQLLSGGDVLSATHVEDVLRQLPSCRLINGYGPTENTTFTTTHPLEDPDEVGVSVPIGRPIANTQVYVLDRRLEPTPIGVAGELYIGGDGLAWGYQNGPNLTAERFLPDPFTGRPGSRLYRTGDRVRWRPTGALEFLGRIDEQVKIRGFRVELGEIETVLGQHAAVGSTAVVARGDTAGDKRLVAYVVPKPGLHPANDELREFLRRTLPEYMIPSSFVLLQALPLTPNGKVDRRALPEPASARPELGASYVAPQTELDRTIAGIWQDVLRLDHVGLHDNFFDLGGHSLLLIQVHGRLRAALQREIAMVDLFHHPTVGALARHLSGDVSDAEPAVREQLIQKMQAGKDRLQQRRQRVKDGR